MNLALGRETLKKIWALKSAIDEVIAPFGESQTADEIYTVANFAEVKPSLLEDEEVSKLYKWAVQKYKGDKGVMKKMINFKSIQGLSHVQCKEKGWKDKETAYHNISCANRKGEINKNSHGNFVSVLLFKVVFNCSCALHNHHYNLFKDGPCEFFVYWNIQNEKDCRISRKYCSRSLQ